MTGSDTITVLHSASGRSIGAKTFSRRTDGTLAVEAYALEAAARLGLKVATLRRWRWARRGPPWIKVGAAVRYAPVDLEHFIESGRASPSGTGSGE